MDWNPEPIEEKIGLQFKHKDILKLSLIHTSYAQQLLEPETNNERLQYLGEAILKLAVVDYLYQNCPYLEVTKLAPLRDKFLEPEKLTNLWVQLGLADGYPFLALKETRAKLRQKRHNPFEQGLKALVGAIYCDRGFSQTRNWLNKYLLAPTLERHLKKIKTRSSPDKQLPFLGEALLSAVTRDYLYHHLPRVRVARLTELSRKILTKERRSQYLKNLDPQEILTLSKTHQGLSKKSLKSVIAGIYLDYSTLNTKQGFPKTGTWFQEQFLDDEEILRWAIELMLKDNKPQKWIIRHVMGYASKDYHEGRERFYEIMDESGGT